MTHNEEMKNAINSFVLSLEEEQKKTNIKSKNENNRDLNLKSGDIKKTDKEGFQYITGVIKKIIEMACNSSDVEIKKDEDYMIEVKGENLSPVIGKNGRNIEAMEHIINMICKKRKIYEKRVALDINGYRKKNIEKLKKNAIKMAEKAVQEGRKVSLKPMPSYERKIIHNILSAIKNVRTQSSNDEPNRRIIIYPVAGNK